MASEINIYMAGNVSIKHAVAMSRGNADQKPFIISENGISDKVMSVLYFIQKIILIVAKSANKKTSIFNNVKSIFFISNLTKG